MISNQYRVSDMSWVLGNSLTTGRNHSMHYKTGDLRYQKGVYSEDCKQPEKLKPADGTSVSVCATNGQIFVFGEQLINFSMEKIQEIKQTVISPGRLHFNHHFAQETLMDFTLPGDPRYTKTFVELLEACGVVMRKNNKDLFFSIQDYEFKIIPNTKVPYQQLRTQILSIPQQTPILVPNRDVGVLVEF